MSEIKVKAKHEIESLIEKYRGYLESNDNIKEEGTKTDLILPMFRALGWNIEDSSEVSKEEKVISKSVDYGFKIDQGFCFLLEAKEIYESLDGTRMEYGERVSYVQKAINYSFNKGCTWAVLTNFKEIRVFNAFIKDQENELFRLSYDQYLLSDRFEQLWLLSKESFIQGTIVKEAEKWGRKEQKIPIDKQLLSDLTTFRELLSKNIAKKNTDKNLTEYELDEAVQRILDRFVFIRNCEDKGMENKWLWERKNEKNVLKALREIFSYYNQSYDSEIFERHLCDALGIDDDILSKVIDGLYRSNDKSVWYDFSLIEADVLGNIYELYLGHILSKTKKRAKLQNGSAYRKEQGIYYTPTYIVDFIIRNTLGEVLKNKRVNIDRIRVLDPACGSGSFLLKAFDILDDYQKNRQTAQIELPFKKKIRILQNNIFGVDLDNKAIEIARLNLLLKIAERKEKLPTLRNNIICGNSLIDDPTVAGYDKAFSWEERFQAVFNSGGFDVLVGNPPYQSMENMNKAYREYYYTQVENGQHRYSTAQAKSNLYAIFLEKAITLTKPNGYIGMITPFSWLSNSSFLNLRKIFIYDMCPISIHLFPVGIFQDVGIATSIIIIRKTKAKRNHKIYVYDFRNSTLVDIPKIINSSNNKYCLSFKQNVFRENNDLIFSVIPQTTHSNIINKIEKDCVSLDKLVCIDRGCDTADNDKYTGDKYIKTQNSKPILLGKCFGRYWANWNGLYLYYLPEDMKSDKKTARPGDYKRFEQEKLIIYRFLDEKKRITAYHDVDKYYCFGSCFVVTRSNPPELDLKYIIAIVNSKLAAYYNKTFFSGTKLTETEIKRIPIRNAATKRNKNKQQKLSSLSTKISELHSRLQKCNDDRTEKATSLQEEIDRIDSKIDDIVYSLYGLNHKEGQFINDSFN